METRGAALTPRLIGQHFEFHSDDEPLLTLPIDPFGDYSPGRWAWLLTDVRQLAVPEPAKGKQGWWEWTPPVLAQCEINDLLTPDVLAEADAAMRATTA